MGWHDQVVITREMWIATFINGLMLGFISNLCFELSAGSEGQFLFVGVVTLGLIFVFMGWIKIGFINEEPKTTGPDPILDEINKACHVMRMYEAGLADKAEACRKLKDNPSYFLVPIYYCLIETQKELRQSRKGTNCVADATILLSGTALIVAFGSLAITAIPDGFYTVLIPIIAWIAVVVPSLILLHWIKTGKYE